jgi:serine protease Do
MRPGVDRLAVETIPCQGALRARGVRKDCEALARLLRTVFQMSARIRLLIGWPERSHCFACAGWLADQAYRTIGLNLQHMKITHLRGAIALGLVTAISGCQNPYTQFYTNQLSPAWNGWLQPHIGEAQFYSISGSVDFNTACDKLGREGYVVIGNASFEANARDYNSALREKAKEVQADIVLVNQSFAGTMTGVMPLMTYQPGQSATTYSTGQVHANAYGTGGYATGTANYSGVSTTTTPGTFSTNYVPYSVQRNNYSAYFLRKQYVVAGWHVAPLSDEQRMALQRNTGFVVNFVMEGSPAFRANILPGDIIIALDGNIAGSEEEFQKLTRQRANQIVKITILRRGTEQIIELKLNALPPGVSAPI